MSDCSSVTNFKAKIAEGSGVYTASVFEVNASFSHYHPYLKPWFHVEIKLF